MAVIHTVVPSFIHVELLPAGALSHGLGSLRDVIPSLLLITVEILLFLNHNCFTIVMAGAQLVTFTLRISSLVSVPELPGSPLVPDGMVPSSGLALTSSELALASGVALTSELALTSSQLVLAAGVALTSSASTKVNCSIVVVN